MLRFEKKFVKMWLKKAFCSFALILLLSSKFHHRYMNFFSRLSEMNIATVTKGAPTMTRVIGIKIQEKREKERIKFHCNQDIRNNQQHSKRLHVLMLRLIMRVYDRNRIYKAACQSHLSSNESTSVNSIYVKVRLFLFFSFSRSLVNQYRL